eukprot:CAMPEP_0114688316 /NCGR_PEP_ID=MMETSP0191-20121206/63346_1 /TAXON_ID=126664 /ORGANISM="Sorites sp." /LENGTH=1102 /DNA_ID=CAMNT_0001975657 /DNA_START=40 /DNA_END=3348 /DNA_ORIENTATION=+
MDQLDTPMDIDKPPDVHAKYTALGDAFVLSLRFSCDHPARKCTPSTRFHFVLDNSGSMGRNSEAAKECFADLAAVATLGVSLVAFNTTAELLGEAFRTPAEMRGVRLPRQGGTNITAGIQASVDLIRKFAEKEDAHHLLVLLSDGMHMSGPPPSSVLPEMGAKLKKDFPRLRLSVVVVGVTRNSDTSMGMLLKETLETVPLDLQPIYFADSPQQMTETLQQMNQGLASLQGSLVSVSLDQGRFIRLVGEDGDPTAEVLANHEEQVLLCQGEAPKILTVDGAACECEALPTLDADLVIKALEKQFDAARVRRVAAGTESTRPAVKKLGEWIAILEAASAGTTTKLELAKANPKMRLAQHRALKTAVSGFRSLRNQLVELDAYSANDSASQAAFLTGATRKYGAKALRRAAAHGEVDPEERRRELITEAKALQPRMRTALWDDLLAKVQQLPKEAQQKLCSELAGSMPQTPAAFREFCLSQTENAAALQRALAEKLVALMGCRQSYVSLQSSWEHLSEWIDFSPEGCNTEYELLMCLGIVGYPMEVERRDATQMNPYAMNITRIRATPVDTASVATALHSEQPVVPPEGGKSVEDVLILVDPEAPTASKLAVSSLLLRETYTSVVLCRDLHMFTGNSMVMALHAHALLAALQPPGQRTDDVVQHLRRQFLGRAYQCASCGYGPIDHFACGDLEAHHGEQMGTGEINNSCPRCQWFSPDIHDWQPWDGKVPDEALPQSSEAEAPCATAAALEVFLRICYSARKLWKTHDQSDLHQLCQKLANWESITSADDVDHPVKLLLALAIVDELPTDALEQVPMLSVLNEACARRAHDELKAMGHKEEPQIMGAARKRVASFLGIVSSSAPETQDLMTPEPARPSVRENCCAEFTLDDQEFDYKNWVKDNALPTVHVLRTIRALRTLLKNRGGWKQLEQDMEKGTQAYADVVQALQTKKSPDLDLAKWLDVKGSREAKRALATIAAQAFLHQSSKLRRTVDAGGCLSEPLPDVRDGETLRNLAVDIRMAIYDERVAQKNKAWASDGKMLILRSAGNASLAEYEAFLGRATHVHGLDKSTFWGLWEASKKDKAKMSAFLRTANLYFAWKHQT